MGEAGNRPKEGGMTSDVQRVEWNRCTCQKIYTGGKPGKMEGMAEGVNPTPEITKINPDCPERSKPGHP